MPDRGPDGRFIPGTRSEITRRNEESLPIEATVTTHYANRLGTDVQEVEIHIYRSEETTTSVSIHWVGRESAELVGTFEDVRMIQAGWDRPGRTMNSWVAAKVSDWIFGIDPQDATLFGRMLSDEARGRIANLIVELWETHNPPCEECGRRHPGNDHFVCASCEDLYATYYEQTIYIYHNEGADPEEHTICSTCMDNSEEVLENLNASSCSLCGIYVCTECTPRHEDYEEYWCWAHWHEFFRFCTGCDRDRDIESWAHDFDMCNECAEEQYDMGSLHEWDYRPTLIFHPELPYPNTSLYTGMEIEMSWGDVNSMQRKIWLGKLDPDILFAKSDSSVSNGFEVVTHPMQPKWALKHFPYHLFDEALELGALETHGSTGTHIHMNKESFTPQHLWKFMQLHFRLAKFCGDVGGRGTNASYGRLESDSGSRGDVVAQRRALMNIVKKKGPITDFDRYVALNLRNEYTIEMRYMRGGIKPSEIKKNFEWALAAFEFTDYLKVRDIREGAIDDPGYLLQWINDGEYPNLQGWLVNKYPVPKKLKERAL